jgi:hypothetical protein
MSFVADSNRLAVPMLPTLDFRFHSFLTLTFIYSLALYLHYVTGSRVIFRRKERCFMALLVGPFMSLDASGTLGGVLTASIWKGRNYMRQRVIPATSQDPDVVANRAMFASAVNGWQSEYAETKTAWNEAARDVYPPISGFNYYVSQYCLQADVPTIPDVAPRKTKKIHGN